MDKRIRRRKYLITHITALINLAISNGINCEQSTWHLNWSGVLSLTEQTRKNSREGNKLTLSSVPYCTSALLCYIATQKHAKSSIHAISYCHSTQPYELISKHWGIGGNNARMKSIRLRFIITVWYVSDVMMIMNSILKTIWQQVDVSVWSYPNTVLQQLIKPRQNAVRMAGVWKWT